MRTIYIAAAMLFAGAAQAQTVKLSPVDSYTVVYDVTGARTGSSIQYSRKFGLEQSQVSDFTAGKVRDRLQLVTLRDKIVSYDPDTKRAGTTPNPSYDGLSVAAAGKDGGALVKALMQALTFSVTQTVQTVAGERCTLWRSDTLAQTRCVTDDGIVLETRTMAGGTVVQRAREVRRGDAGPDSVYAAPAGVVVVPVKSMDELPGVAG